MVYTPPIVAIAAVPASPPTQSQITYAMNQGWNSYARTVGELLPGTYIEYTIKPGTYGALMAVGKAGMEGVSIDAFPYGLLVDTAGIYRFEAGATFVMSTSNTNDLVLRIARLTDDRIVYSVGGEVVISAVDEYLVSDALYVYGMLYSAYDEVSTAEFIVGNIIGEPSAYMYGSGGLVGMPLPSVGLDGAGELLVAFDTAVLMTGAGTVTASFSHTVGFIDADLTGSGSLFGTLVAGGRASFDLTALAFLASDAASEYLGFGSTEVPLFTFAGTSLTFIPAQPTAGYFNIPEMTIWADGTEVDFGVGETYLPYFQAQASEGEYGIGYLSMFPLYSSGHGGLTAANVINLVSAGVISGVHSDAVDLVMVLNSSGQLVSAFGMTRAQALELISSGYSESTVDILGVYGYDILSNMRGITLQTLSVNDRPDLHDGGVVWVINRDTGASSQYEQYGFNSFFQRGEKYYGVADDGVYLLEGGTDAGSDVSALVEMGRTNLGYTNDKRVPTVYLGVGSDAELYLKVDVDTQTYVYSMRTSGEAVRNRPVETGWNVSGCYWNFTLVNPNGSDFNLASMAFTPVPLARRG